jgi:SAM-dependent methyltransferase
MMLPNKDRSVHVTAQPDMRILPFGRRLKSAMQRRVAWQWQEWTGQHRPPAVPNGMKWLRSVANAGGVPLHTGSREPCPGVTAALLSTLVSLGESDLAVESADWLLSIQLANGGFPDAGLQRSSVFNTGRALQGLLSSSEKHSWMLPAAYRAAHYLADRIDARGFIVPESDREDSSAGGAFDRWTNEGVRWTILPALVAAGRRLNEPSWETAAQRALQHARRRLDLADWHGPSHWFGLMVDALADLNQRPEFECRELLDAALRLPTALQRRDGSIPVAPNSKETSAAGQALWATLWYKLGQRERADRALHCLQQRQTASGGFPLRWQRGRTAVTSSQGTWAMKHFFDAAQWQVRVSFEDEQPDLPSEIDPTDGRMLAIQDWFADLGPRAIVADVGCGQGRFLRHVAGEFPAAKLIGVDISQQMLSQLPHNVEGRLGTMLNLPIKDGELDAAFAVESLEHSLLPERAIDELCRVVRPGGQILIIDKHRDRQALSEHEPWEQWFRPEEVSNWLFRQCRDVTATPITHGNASTTGLFVCWRAVRREATAKRLVA